MNILGNPDFSTELVQNPVRKDCITWINMSYTKGIFTGVHYFKGTVVFTKGNTSLEQKFEGTDLADLFMKIAKFCNNLPG